MTTITASGPDTSPVRTEPRTSWATLSLICVGLACLLAVLLSVFAWPATQTRPRDLPIAVAGPPEAVEQVRTAVTRAQPGAFVIRQATDGEHARGLVVDRAVDGAIVLGPDGPSVIIATQGGPAVAQAVTQLGDVLAGGDSVPVDDVAPAPADDLRGAGLASGVLPLALTGAVAGALLCLVVHGAVRRLTGALLFAVLGGFTAVSVLHGWLGALTGNWVAEASVVALGLAAISAGLIGAHAVAGRTGLAVAELTIVMLGNPLSAAAAAPAMLPDGWSELGQALPPGAVVAALRSVSGFDGTGAAGPIAVLSAWLCVGLLLLVAGVWWPRPAADPIA